ncbi:uncharacterized protein PAC_15726 [Phialocephala subalpina]|uniref:LysM domain-containing protein n=1 Tax=Phialocephala subalpina TaxID=576137 RepID=A0A1L7XLK9_9HELO|nr:uncharacterized protein PAC_15726 [Phialocephala subalpina]
MNADSHRPPGGVYIPPIATVATPSVYITTAIPASPTPSGTITNCGLYYTVEAGDDCSFVSEKFGLTFSDFINLNPSIDSACPNLILGDDYCRIQRHYHQSTRNINFEVLSNGYILCRSSKCNSSGNYTILLTWYTVVSGDSCSDVAAAYGLTLAEFIALTPMSTRRVTASGRVTATACLGSVITPTPTQTGMVSSCTVFYEAKSSDGCYDIATAYGITLDQFYAWNPAVGACANLWPGYYYCVGM